MVQTYEAIIDSEGNIRLLESVNLPISRRALVVVLEEEPSIQVSETALLSEKTLAEDWNRPEEDQAWAHLQQGKLS
ncbi:MAG: hypothetical protein FJ319_11130 [SAR202 cluster bacterium]|nr:hypothetical protein [SAR202 cluster bacterium]